MEGIYVVDFSEDGEEPTVSDSGADDNPTDDEMFAIFEQHRKGAGEAPQHQAAEGAEPTDDELWAAYTRAWGGGDA